jgi:hypothetical protein
MTKDIRRSNKEQYQFPEITTIIIFLSILFATFNTISSCKNESRNGDTLFSNFVYGMMLYPDTFPKKFEMKDPYYSFFIKRIMKDSHLVGIELIDSFSGHQEMDKIVNIYVRKYGIMKRIETIDTIRQYHIVGASKIQWEGLNPNTFEVINIDPFGFTDDNPAGPHLTCGKACHNNKNQQHLDEKRDFYEIQDEINKFCLKWHIHVSPKSKSHHNKEKMLLAEPVWENVNIIIKTVKYTKKINGKEITLVGRNIININDLDGIGSKAIWRIKMMYEPFRVIYSYPDRERNDSRSLKLRDSLKNEKVKGKIHKTI